MTRITALASALAVGMLAISSFPLSASERSGNSFVGSWAVTATPAPGGPPPFAGLLTLNADGTLTETNAGVHPLSASPLLPFGGSDGHGTWARARGGRQIAITFYKLLFDPAGTHVGYLRVRGIFERDAQSQDNFAGDTIVDLVFGPNPLAPAAQTLASTRVEGTKLSVILP